MWNFVTITWNFVKLRDISWKLRENYVKIHEVTWNFVKLLEKYVKFREITWNYVKFREKTHLAVGVHVHPLVVIAQ